jgi:hypothetical protein
MSLRRVREKSHDRLQDGANLLRAQLPYLLKHQRLVRGEKFARPHVTGQRQTSADEIMPIQADGARVCLRLARDLAENPITAPDIGEHKGRADLALREIRERKRDEYYRTG